MDSILGALNPGKIGLPGEHTKNNWARGNLSSPDFHRWVTRLTTRPHFAPPSPSLLGPSPPPRGLFLGPLLPPARFLRPLPFPHAPLSPASLPTDARYLTNPQHGHKPLSPHAPLYYAPRNVDHLALNFFPVRPTFDFVVFERLISFDPLIYPPTSGSHMSWLQWIPVGKSFPDK